MTKTPPRRLSNVANEPTWTFFRQWLRNPLGVAAVSPSSRELAENMVRELPDGATRVVELGGGTGVFTRALLERGIAPDRLLVLELNQTLHQHLQQRFPDTRVVCADARDLARIVKQTGFDDDGPVDAVVSGLGLLSMSKSLQKAIVESAFSVLAPQGRLIQFTYGPTVPVRKDVLDELDLSVRRASFTLWNVPPAAVYVLTRAKSRRVHPVRASRG
jgi:phospholipid N-methyltransferase